MYINVYQEMHLIYICFEKHSEFKLNIVSSFMVLFKALLK